MQMIDTGAVQLRSHHSPRHASMVSLAGITVSKQALAISSLREYAISSALESKGK